MTRHAAGPWRWRWADYLWLRRLGLIVFLIPAILISAIALVCKEILPEVPGAWREAWRRHETDR